MQGSQEIYEYHNKNRRGEGFVILEEARAHLLKERIGTGKKVLDLGCRDGALTKYFLQGNEVLGADIDTVALANAAKLGIKTLHIDLNADWTKTITEKYDVVVLAETLEHLYYPDKVVGRIRSVLKPGGMLIGTVPNGFSLKNRLRLVMGKKYGTTLNDPTHINHFKHSELKKLMLKHFSTAEIVPLGNYAKYDKFWPGMLSFDLAFIGKV